MSRQSSVALLLVTATCLTTSAQAGQACEQKAADPQAVSEGMALAVATAKALDASGANVVMLARAGQHLSAYRLNCSHLGFAYLDTGGAKPVWRVLHRLNHCGAATSALCRQGFGEFFLDRPHRFEAAFVALTPELQSRLLPLLKDNVRVGVLNEVRYSMVAYASGQTCQQSNQ